MDLSYAQHLEDFHLARAFGDQREGFYVDVGAGHPVALLGQHHGVVQAVDQHHRGVGAIGQPGVAFGPEGYVRWCFAASDEQLLEGAARLERGLQYRPR